MESRRLARSAATVFAVWRRHDAPPNATVNAPNATTPPVATDPIFNDRRIRLTKFGTINTV
jgi:hypothetical protein